MASIAVLSVSKFLLRRHALLQLLLVLPRSLHSLCMFLAAFEVRHRLLVPLTVLPRHVNEFILIRQHIFLVQVMDLHEPAVLIPSVDDTSQCA